MSEEKRQQLIADGKLNPDGSRKLLCPTCQTELSPEQYEQYVVGQPGDATAEVQTNAATVQTEG